MLRQYDRGTWRESLQSPVGGARRRCDRRQGRAVLVNLNVRDFLFELHFEFIGGAAELVDELSGLAGDLRQFLGPKDDERQEEQEDRLGKTHAFHHTAQIRTTAMFRAARVM